MIALLLLLSVVSKVFILTCWSYHWGKTRTLIIRRDHIPERVCCSLYLCRLMVQRTSNDNEVYTQYIHTFLVLTLSILISSSIFTYMYIICVVDDIICINIMWCVL